MIFSKCSAAALFITVALTVALAADSETWRFDNLQRIGGHTVTLQGNPQLIQTPQGKAVQFNGVDDAIFMDVHPLAGAATWTWEVIFRPDAGGAPEQRFFHLQENATDSRMLFEIRIVEGKWCLDSFAKSGADSATLIDRAKLHPLGEWYRVAAVYDGHQFRNYVNGVLEESADLHLAPQSAGRCSIGVRINKQNYFKGAVAAARMTPRALAVGEFLNAGK
jgi:Concanavalin A-like lectin/glucanases superfamily